MAVGKAGIEQQHPLGMHHQETGIGEIRIANLLQGQAETFGLIGDDGAAIQYVKSWTGDFWQRRQAGRRGRLGRYAECQKTDEHQNSQDRPEA